MKGGTHHRGKRHHPDRKGPQPAPPALNAPQADHKGDRGKEEQRPKSTLAELASVVLSFVGVVAVGIGIYVANETLKTMNAQTEQMKRSVDLSNDTLAAMNEQTQELIRSVDVASRQFEITDRPWVTVDVSLDKWFTGIGTIPGEVQADFAVEMQNIGQTVATDVTVYAEIVAIGPDRGDHLEPLKRQTTLCGGARQSPPNKLGGMALFPDQKETTHVALSLNVVEIRAVFLRFVTRESKKLPRTISQIPFTPIRPVVVGCVSYRYPSSSRNHQTGFAYALTGNPFWSVGYGMDLDSFLSLKLGEGVIGIGRYWGAGNYAD